MKWRNYFSGHPSIYTWNMKHFSWMSLNSPHCEWEYKYLVKQQVGWTEITWHVGAFSQAYIFSSDDLSTL